MSYFEKTQILSADSPSIDAFGRWRVSGITTLFDSSQLHDSEELSWSTQIIGNATSSVNLQKAGNIMITGPGPSSVIRQTRRFLQYQPGKSFLVVATGNFSGSSNNTIKRIGYFNENNGLFLKVQDLVLKPSFVKTV